LASWTGCQMIGDAKEHSFRAAPLRRETARPGRGLPRKGTRRHGLRPLPLPRLLTWQSQDDSLGPILLSKRAGNGSRTHGIVWKASCTLAEYVSTEVSARQGDVQGVGSRDHRVEEIRQPEAAGVGFLANLADRGLWAPPGIIDSIRAPQSAESTPLTLRFSSRHDLASPA